MNLPIFAALYLRKSRDKAELADPDLLHKHRREGLRWARERGVEVPPELIFEEIGSGDRIAARPAVRRLLDLIGSRPRGSGGYLWTTEVSRLTRGDLDDRAVIYRTLLNAGIRHCTRQGEFDLKNPHQRKQWEDLAGAAHYELGVIKERMEGGRVDMILEGRILTGKPPFGWWWDRNERDRHGNKGKIQTDPARFPIVQALCREVMTLSTQRLAEKYGMGQGTVYNLLTNPFIAGYPARRHYPHGWERVRRDNGEPWKYGSHKVPRDQWLRAEQPGDYEPACTPAEFDAIQRVLQERWRGCHTDQPNGWARRLVRFAGHEGHARLSAKAPAPGRRYLTYELSQPARRGKVYIKREAVHAAAEACILRALDRSTMVQDVLDAYQEERDQFAYQPAAEDALQQEIKELEDYVDDLLEIQQKARRQQDRETLASVSRKRADYTKRLEQARLRLKAISSQSSADPGIDDLIRSWPHISDLRAEDWRGMEDDDRAIIANGLLAGVRCRVEPVPGRQAWRREIEEVSYTPLIARMLQGSK